MENKSSKIIPILLGIIAISLIAVVVLLVHKNKIDQKKSLNIIQSDSVNKSDNSENILEINKSNKTNQEEIMEYGSDRLGFSFTYPKKWGTINEKITNDLTGFFYEIIFSNLKGLFITGTSNPYESHGRDSWYDSLTEASLRENFCKDGISQVISSKNNVEGMYSYETIIAYAGDCGDYQKTYNAAFDVDKKIKNLVIVGDPKNISESEFKTLVESISF